MTMTTESTVSVSVTVGDQEIVFETGKLAKQADGAVVVRSGDDDRACDGPGPTRSTRGSGLLPAHRRRRGAHVRRREDPRRLLQARRTSHGARHPHGAHDRPPDSAALAEGLQERGAGDLHHPLRRPRRGARHPVHQRRLRGAHDLAAALHGPGRRRAHRHGGRRVRRQPDAAGGAGVDARPRRRRHEGRADDDRGRRRRDPRGEDDRGLRARARGDPTDLRGAGGAPGEGGQAEVARPVADRRAALRARHTHRGRHRRPRAEGGLRRSSSSSRPSSAPS